uniref:SFRICE_003675 n=1 Tax=Spodoptera frugiperda TaxID=7108 RepID=A0A2H1V4L8_SPOFR
MRCLVVLLLLAGCASLSAAAGVPCALSLDFFGRHNVTADDKDVPVAIADQSLFSHREGLIINHHVCSMRVGDFKLVIRNYKPRFPPMFSLTYVKVLILRATLQYHRGSLSNGLDSECAYHLKYQQMTSILSGRSGDRRTRRSADLACHP